MNLLLCLTLAATTAAGQDGSERRTSDVPAYPDHAKLMVVRDGTGRELPVKSRADWDVRRDHILAHFQEVAGPLPGADAGLLWR